MEAATPTTKFIFDDVSDFNEYGKGKSYNRNDRQGVNHDDSIINKFNNDNNDTYNCIPKFSTTCSNYFYTIIYALKIGVMPYIRPT